MNFDLKSHLENIEKNGGSLSINGIESNIIKHTFTKYMDNNKLFEIVDKFHDSNFKSNNFEISKEEKFDALKHIPITEFLIKWKGEEFKLIKEEKYIMVEIDFSGELGELNFPDTKELYQVVKSEFRNNKLDGIL